MLHTHEATGSSPVVSTKNHRNRLIPVIFFRNSQLFCALNFWRFFKTHTLTHTGKRPESTGQGQTGFFLSGDSSYFYACAVSSVIRSAYSSGYKVIVFENGEDYEQEVKICQFLQKSGIDGLVVAPARTTNDLDHFVKLQHEGIPMVFFDRIAPNLDTDRVLEDDYKGACTVVRHMIDGGCRKIAHIALPRRYLWAQKREKGYLQALKDRHLFTDEKLIVECEDVSEVYRITRQLVLHSGVDGIFAANDAFAVHVLSVLRQMKCRVPEEVAVCGYGNEPSTEVTFPALTTVNKDGYRVGNIAAGLLIRRIEDKEEVPTVTRLLKPELIVRDSTLSVDR